MPFRTAMNMRVRDTKRCPLTYKHRDRQAKGEIRYEKENNAGDERAVQRLSSA